MFPTLKIIEYFFLCEIGSQMHLKVTKILRIYQRSFANFDPRVLNSDFIIEMITLGESLLKITWIEMIG
jgi:hypothetical protein